jgi:hypothetical protein
MFVLCLTTVAALLPAQTAPRVLWIVDDALDANTATLLETSLAKSAPRTIVRRDEAKRELARISESLGEDPERAFQRHLELARKNFLELQLGASEQAYTQALEILLANDRRPASAERVARVAFERALVALAAQKRAGAERELSSTLSLDPAFSPDPNQYGPPVLRAVEAARRVQERAPAISLKIERAPPEAIVRLDGKLVAEGETVAVRGRGPHLLTAELDGFRARSELLFFDPKKRETRAAVVLERASGALLAAQVLAAWKSESLSSELALGVARVLGLKEIIEAHTRENQTIDLVLRDVARGAVLRSVSGRRVDWEPWPFAVLTESLAGRVLDRQTLTMTLSAPAQVEPSSSMSLAVQLEDSASRVRFLSAECGPSRAKLELAAGHSSGTHVLSLFAPEEENELPCSVLGIDATGATIVRAPPAEERLLVQVAELPGSPWYARWYVWTALAVALAGGITGGVLATREAPDPQNVLVLDVLP